MMKIRLPLIIFSYSHFYSSQLCRLIYSQSIDWVFLKRMENSPLTLPTQTIITPSATATPTVKKTELWKMFSHLRVKVIIAI